MTHSRDRIRTWEAPSACEVGRTVVEFLERLGGPAWLHFPGRDRARSRAISTLLHGNEPSGIRALHEWIRSEARPAVDLVCFIGAVDAALAPPGFANRFLPGRKDLNRCFREPFDGPEGLIAGEMLRRLHVVKPEALLDLHNTSGASPAYAVSARHSLAHEALTTLFSRHLVLTDIRLGTLMEATADDFPTITVECGGAQDIESDTLASKGLFSYTTADSVLVSAERDLGVTILKHPIRVKLRDGARVAYAPTPAPDVDLTLPPDVDRYNFGVVEAGRVFGWLGSCGLTAITARDAEGNDRVREIFTERDGCLRVAYPTRFFMVTTDPYIARNDCLFYAIRSETPPADA